MIYKKLIFNINPEHSLLEINLSENKITLEECVREKKSSFFEVLEYARPKKVFFSNVENFFYENKPYLEIAIQYFQDIMKVFQVDQISFEIPEQIEQHSAILESYKIITIKEKNKLVNTMYYN